MQKGSNHSESTKKKMSISHTGLKFSESHKKNHLVAVRKKLSSKEYRENMSKVKTGKANVFYSGNGASEMNHNAKDWWFIKNKKHYRFRSLNKFVRDNKNLFTDDELTEYKTEGRAAPVYRATVMLRQLHLLKKNGEPVIASNEWHGWVIGEKWEVE